MVPQKFKSLLKSILSRYQTLHLEYPVDMKPRYGFGKPVHQGLNAIIEVDRNVYKSWLQTALDFREQFVQWPVYDPQHPSLQPSWNNGFLPGLDMVMLYALIASGKPSTYVEIGSGNSTKIPAHNQKEGTHHVHVQSRLEPGQAAHP